MRRKDSQAGLCGQNWNLIQVSGLCALELRWGSGVFFAYQCLLAAGNGYLLDLEPAEVRQAKGSSFSTIRNTCPVPSKEPAPAYHRAKCCHTRRGRRRAHPLLGEDWSEGHHLAPFAPGLEGGSQGELARARQRAEKCMPQQKRRLINQRFWLARDPCEIYGCFRGLGKTPSRKGAYFEALEGNRVF